MGRRIRILWVALIVVSITVAVSATGVPGEAARPFSCTNFMVANQGAVFLGDSEDAGPGHPLAANPDDAFIFFFPASPTAYGRMHLGWLWLGQHNSYQAGMNAQGLAYGLTTVPELPLTPDPTKPFQQGRHGMFDLWMRQAATVEQAIEITQQFSLERMWYQVMLADADGDAAVIAPGPDGELAITRKPAADAWQVASTFNLAHPQHSIGKDSFTRYDDARKILESADTADLLSIAERALDAVHRERAYALGGTYTVYSTLYDLTNGVAYHYHLSDFDDPVRIDLAVELARGEHVVPITDLVSETVRQDALQRYRAKQYAGIGVAAAAVLGVLTIGVLLVLKLLGS